MESKISEKMMREVYFKAFGKEYDSLDRKQTPLPLEIAYKVALNKLKRDKKYEFGGEITEDIYYKSVNDFVFFCLNYPSNFLNIFGGFEKHFANKFKAYYNGYGSYGAMIKLYIELDSNNRRLLTDFAYENYDGSFSKSNISEVEYYNSVNHFVFFCFNFPNNFMEAFPIHLRVHLSEKWSDAYRKKGSIGAMIYFWSLLSDDNRKKLADWVRVNYTGTRLYELGGALGDVAGMLPSPLPMSTIQPMEKGGRVGYYNNLRDLLELRDNGIKTIILNGFRENIGYVIDLKLDDQDLIKIEDGVYETTYKKGGQIELFADGGGIKVGDVVGVKEPNYGRDRDYYVVADNVGYDRNDFLISDVKKREQGVFEEEQLEKLYADGGGVGKKSDRNETQENNFGVSYKLGDKFILGKRFGNNKDEEVFITEIMPSGLFFKVNKSDKTFSIKTLHSKGSTYTSGEYLVPIKNQYSDGGGVYEINDDDLTSEKKEERKKLKENIIKALFIDKEFTVTEVTFKYQGKYSVPNTNKQDIRNMVFEINQSKKYPHINIGFTNSGVLYLDVPQSNKMADGGGVKLNNLFDENELINLIKTYDFKTADVSNLERITYSESENPFKLNDNVWIQISPKDDWYGSLIIVIEKVKNHYEIRIGKDTGWTGGLEIDSTEFAFDIPKLTFEEFKKGFLNATINQNYCLYSKDSKKIHLIGSLQEIKDYALQNGYELEEYGNIIVLRSKNLSEYDDEHTLVVSVLSSTQIQNLQNNYKNGGGVKSDYYIFEGVDNLNGNPLYRVESSSESDIEYIGEWNTNRNDAQNELDELLNKSKKTLGVVKVIFENPAYNYSTNVGVDVTEEEARNYFVGKMFDVGAFPKENMQKAIDIEFSKSKDNYADGGEIVDLFEDYENIPANVQEVFDRYSEKFGDDLGGMNYQDMANMQKEVEKLGYTFDSYLDNVPFGLRPVGVELNQLRGYEEYGLGGFLFGAGVGALGYKLYLDSKTKKGKEKIKKTYTKIKKKVGLD